MEVEMNNATPSVEELQKTNQMLIERVNSLQNQLSQVMNMNNTLHWLFRAMDHADKFSPEFVQELVKQLEGMLTPPKESEIVQDENK